MTSNTYIEIESKQEEIRELKELENRMAEAETHCFEAYLRLKDECEERYRELGRWVVDTVDDLPF
mgnify:CR=1 FL=1|jgi:hypothetical protein